MVVDKVSKLPFLLIVKAYFTLTKPGIILGNILTASGGFALASRGDLDGFLFITMVLGLTFVIGSACVFNNYIDQDLDEKMTRTRNRPLVKKLIAKRSALVFATILALLSILLFYLFINLLTLCIAFIGFFIYVGLYSFLRYHSIYATLVGSLAGAIPPVVGYCAVSHCFDLGALVLFGMIMTWQMPHFFAIAIYRLEDYIAGALPILPLQKGLHRTKLEMVCYIIAFIGLSLMLTLFQYAGYVYLIVVSALSLVWLWLGVQGFTSRDDQLWARKMFRFSLLIVMALPIVIPFSTL